MAIGLGIPLHAIGNALCITAADFARLKRFVKRTRIPYGPGPGRRSKAEAAGV